MLEAFQRSARESAERAAAERRRVIADREKESRRAEASRTAHELGHRLSQRAGGSVGSFLAGIRGAGVGAEAQDDGRRGDLPGDLHGELPAAGPRTPKSTPAAAGVDRPATDIHRVPPPSDQVEAEVPEGVDGQEQSRRSGPALPGFDRASHGDLTQVATSPRAGSLPVGHTSAGAAGYTSGPESGEPAPAASARSGSGSAEGVTPESELDEDPFGHATHEDVEHAIASLEDDVFEMPMSARTFLLVAAVVVATVFVMGYSAGARSAPGSSPVGDASVGWDGGSSSTSMVFDAPALGQRQEPSAGRGAGPAGGRFDFSGLAYAGRGGASDAGSVVQGGAPSGAVVPLPGSREASSDQDALAQAGRVLTAEDKIFQSPAMKYTIMAITYEASDDHARMAMETYDYLYGERFPVIHPVESDGRLFIFVGAAKTQAELDSLRGELKELRSGQGGAQEFRSAYVVNIDPYR